MKQDDVPEGDWMLLDKYGDVIYHSKIGINVLKEGNKYPIGEVSISRKFTGLIF